MFHCHLWAFLFSCRYKPSVELKPFLDQGKRLQSTRWVQSRSRGTQHYAIYPCDQLWDCNHWIFRGTSHVEEFFNFERRVSNNQSQTSHRGTGKKRDFKSSWWENEVNKNSPVVKQRINISWHHTSFHASRYIFLCLQFVFDCHLWTLLLLLKNFAWVEEGKRLRSPRRLQSRFRRPYA